MKELSTNKIIKLLKNCNSVSEALEELDKNRIDLTYLTEYSAMKDFIKDLIDDDNLEYASYLLNKISDYTDYYLYDYSMGTMDEPEPVEDIDTIIEQIEKGYYTQY